MIKEKIKNQLLKLMLVMGVLFVFVTCGKTENKADGKVEEKIKVTTTLNYFVNLVEEIGGDKVEVEGLMNEGEDPHLYVATAGDVTKLQNADL